MKAKTNIRKIIVRLFLAVFAVYAVISLVDMQLGLAQRKQELQELQTRLEATGFENKELKRRLSAEMDESELERIARELGYVAPDERVFIDISGR